jgi:enoyl-CoA hydratase
LRNTSEEANVTNAIVVDRPSERVRIVRLSRPESLNAFTHDMVAELHQALAALGDDDECLAVVLTGTGRGFCAGLDLKGWGTAPRGEGKPRVERASANQEHISTLVRRLLSVPQPVIAAVNGPAAGMGLSLATACDMRIAARSATFSAPFVKLGLSGGDVGLSWLLPRAVGTTHAFELMLTGRKINARTRQRGSGW